MQVKAVNEASGIGLALAALMVQLLTYGFLGWLTTDEREDSDLRSGLDSLSQWLLNPTRSKLEALAAGMQRAHPSSIGVLGFVIGFFFSSILTLWALISVLEVEAHLDARQRLWHIDAPPVVILLAFVVAPAVTASLLLRLSWAAKRLRKFFLILVAVLSGPAWLLCGYVISGTFAPVRPEHARSILALIVCFVFPPLLIGAFAYADLICRVVRWCIPSKARPLVMLVLLAIVFLTAPFRWFGARMASRLSRSKRAVLLEGAIPAAAIATWLNFPQLWVDLVRLVTPGT